MPTEHERYMRRAIELARDGIEANDGGPFGAVVVLNGEIIGEGCNRVTSTNDPTAHAEVVAIREACARLGTFQLDGCTIYTSCEPCTLCTATIHITSALQQHDLELSSGALRLLDLPPGVPARVELELREGTLLGARNRRMVLEVTGGLGGLLVDTREIPLRLPDRSERRRALLEAWERPVWATSDT